MVEDRDSTGQVVDKSQAKVEWMQGVVSDTGREGVTGAAEDRGRFRTPPLRQLVAFLRSLSSGG